MQARYMTAGRLSLSLCVAYVGSLAILASPRAGAQDLAPGEGSWKQALDSKDSKDQIYYIIAAGKNGLTGRRVPAYAAYLETRLELKLDGEALRGVILYIDTKEASPWADLNRAPRAQWEFQLGKDELGPTLEGRWEVLDADFDATSDEALVLSREWQNRKLSRLPRIGGTGDWQREVTLPKCEDLSDLSARVFEGTYADADGKLAEMSSRDGSLNLQYNGRSMSLEVTATGLIGTLDDAAVRTEVTLVPQGNTLVGRIAWHDYDKQFDTVVQSGASPLRFERLIVAGPSRTSADAAAPEASEFKLEDLAGPYRWGKRELEAKVTDTNLTLDIPGLRLSNFSVNNGILTATEDVGAVSLAWELRVEDSRLIGRRQWCLHRKGESEKIQCGWASVEIERLPRPAPIEEPKVEEPKVEEPKVEEPVVVEEPKVEEPKVEEPKVEEPKVEEPKVEEPKVEEPKVEIPVVVEEPIAEPVLYGDPSLGKASDESRPILDGVKESPVGTWKLGSGQYLRLSESTDGSLSGDLRWNGKVASLTMTLEGEVWTGTWVTSGTASDAPSLKALYATPADGNGRLKLQWKRVQTKGSAQETLEEGWVELTLKRLRRLG